MDLSFSVFVTDYWRKLRRSGAEWTPGAVAEDTGWPLTDVVSLYNFCSTKDALSDAQLLALNPILKRTPWGLVIQTGSVDLELLDKKVADITVRELLSAIKEG